MKPYAEFRAAIRLRESSNNYACRNEYGFLGAYQFGRARLTDLGICTRIPGTHGFANSSFEFRPPWTEGKFLSKPMAQDALFDRHVADLKRRIAAVFHGANVSGAIAACHLVGFEAFCAFVATGKITRDALGTSVRDYFEEFAGYEV